MSLCLYDPTRCTIFHASFTLSYHQRALFYFAWFVGTRPKTARARPAFQERFYGWLSRRQHHLFDKCFVRATTDTELISLFVQNILYVLCLACHSPAADPPWSWLDECFACIVRVFHRYDTSCTRLYTI